MDNSEGTDSQIVIVMGPSGAGKTTVGQRLAEALGWTFVEGDDLHSAANIAKMDAGIPLSEADRLPWLTALRHRIEQLLSAGEPAVIACSALRERHRARLRVVPERIHFVYLKADAKLLKERLETRTDHFMTARMLDSQLAAFEEPGDALVIDASLPLEKLVARLRDLFG